MTVTEILLIAAILFALWTYFIKSKFKVGNTVSYYYKSKIHSGEIEHVGETFVVINNTRIPKKDVYGRVH